MALGQPVPIDLEAMTQSGLHDPRAGLDLGDQSVHVGHEFVIDAVEVLGDDRAEQQPAEPGRRVDRQHHVAERHATRRHRRAGVPDLELGEQHDVAAQTYGRSNERSSCAAPMTSDS